VGFIAHGNPQIRLAANEALVPYSLLQPSIFRTDELKPVKDLKLLIRDHPVGEVAVPAVERRDAHSCVENSGTCPDNASESGG
jgi:hypothetical protein